MNSKPYLMENAEEALRLDLKTAMEPLARQASWAGLKPGMRVLDLGCGSGKTTSFLHQLVQPGGSAIGLDGSAVRIEHAKTQYAGCGADYVCRNFYQPLNDLGQFDFIWVRFVLEYHRQQSFEIVKNLSRLLSPGGILCLIDLDHNCLNHFGLPERLEKALFAVMGQLEQAGDFDPYMGRKLYSYLYDLDFKQIDLDLAAHHLIFGELDEMNRFNWTKKLEVAASQAGHLFAEYAGGPAEFMSEFETFFSDPRRFTYTPLIACRGVKPD